LPIDIYGRDPLGKRGLKGEPRHPEILKRPTMSMEKKK